MSSAENIAPGLLFYKLFNFIIREMSLDSFTVRFRIQGPMQTLIRNHIVKELPVKTVQI